MSANNIFFFSSKELTTDAFIAWYVKEFNKTPTSLKLASKFFFDLGLCKSPDDTISDISPSLQEKKTDLIIRYTVNGKATQALFENKIYTTVHSNQLKKYYEMFPNFDYYKYLKLGYINFQERKDVESVGYEIIDVFKLKKALEDFSSNMIADQYRDFLQKKFIDNQNDIIENLIEYNKYHLFKFSGAQQYFLSRLHEKLCQQIPYLYFKHEANIGGTPWTQLDFAKRENAYGDKAEYLFWRIDKRGKGFYLRLNQYSYVDEQNWPKKEMNLQVLRNYVSSLLSKHGFVNGQIINKGKKESEVIILFFVDNPLSKITDLLPMICKDIYLFYSTYNQWS